MAEATVQYEEQARWDAFVARSAEWEAIVRHRRFLAAARASIATADAPGDIDAFLASAEQLLDRRDPVLHPELILADIKPPKPEDLRQFLDGGARTAPTRSARSAGERPDDLATGSSPLVTMVVRRRERPWPRGSRTRR